MEILIAVTLSALVAGAALEFYLSMHDTWITQQNVSEMQQSLRVCVNEMVSRLRNAGSGLPEGLAGISGADTNPDTITLRFASTPSNLIVGSPTNKSQAVPVHVERFSDLSDFQVGDRVFIYRPPNGPGEFFTITKLSENAGAGWKEVHHQNDVLVSDPEPGDVIMKLQEARYWIDNSRDSLHPQLIREQDGVSNAYADEIDDLQFRYTLIDGTVVDVPVAGDTVVSVDVGLSSWTVKEQLTLAGDAGRLTRDAQATVTLRNHATAE